MLCLDVWTFVDGEVILAFPKEKRQTNKYWCYKAQTEKHAFSLIIMNGYL